MDTGEKEILTMREDSCCLFFDELVIENYKIKLRIDWSDLDVAGHPTLDADFYDATTGKKLPLKGDRSVAHHTCSISSQARIYKWEFRKFDRPFKVMVCWIVSVKDSISMLDRASCDVLQNGVKVDD